MDKEVMRKIDDIERLAYEIAAATRDVRNPDYFAKDMAAAVISAENVAKLLTGNTPPPLIGEKIDSDIPCQGVRSGEIKCHAITADCLAKVLPDISTYPLKIERSMPEKEPDAIVQDEYLKEGREVLELRFPDNDSGWDHWNRLLAGVRKNEKKFSVIIEEVEPGKIKAVLHLL